MTHHVPLLPVLLDRLASAIADKTGTHLPRHDVLAIASAALGKESPRALTAAYKGCHVDAATIAQDTTLVTLHDPIAERNWAIDATLLDDIHAHAQKSPMIRSPYGHVLRAPATPQPSTTATEPSDDAYTIMLASLIEDNCIPVMDLNRIFNPTYPKRPMTADEARALIRERQSMWANTSPRASLTDDMDLPSFLAKASAMKQAHGSILALTKYINFADHYRPVLATICDDRREVTITLDIGAYLATKPDTFILEAVEYNEATEATDDILDWPAIQGHYDLQCLYTAINNAPDDEAGYTVSIDVANLLVWIAHHRPYLYPKAINAAWNIGHLTPVPVSPVPTGSTAMMVCITNQSDAPYTSIYIPWNRDAIVIGQTAITPITLRAWTKKAPSLKALLDLPELQSIITAIDTKDASYTVHAVMLDG